MKDGATSYIGVPNSPLAWRIPWTEGPGGLQSVGSHGVGHDWSNLACTLQPGSCSPSLQPWRGRTVLARSKTSLVWPQNRSSGIIKTQVCFSHFLIKANQPKENGIPSDQRLEKLSHKCCEFFVTPNFFHQRGSWHGGDSLNGKTGCALTSALAWLQSTRINWSWGFSVDGNGVFFLFFSFFSTWEPQMGRHGNSFSFA